MKKSLIATVAAGLVLATASAAGPAAAGSLPYAPKDCTKPKIEPNRIALACADLGILVKHIDWDSWSADGASGSGTLYAAKCDPNCAEDDSFAKYPVEIDLANVKLKKCGGEEIPLFRKAYITFTAQPPEFADQVAKNKLLCVPTGDGL